MTGLQLTAERVRELFDYDPHSGLITNRVRRAKAPPGAISTYRHICGYLAMSIDCKRYLAHRVIWFWMTGKWPVSEIDHIDLDRNNNAWVNLREATSSQNRANRKAQRNNSSGFKGVTFHKPTRRWRAKIKNGSHHFHLGLFERPEDAHAAYVKAAEQHFCQFARAS